MAIMTGMGANAGSLSPIAPTGVIVNGVMEQFGMGGYEVYNYLNNMMAHTVVVFTAYFAFGGLKLLGRYHEGAVDVPSSDGSDAVDDAGSVTFSRTHLVTLAVIATLIVSVIFFDVDVGLGAFAGAVLLSLFKAGDELEAVKIMPWRVIMMVCGVTVLIEVLGQTGGLDLFTDLIERPAAVAPTFIMAASTGFISIYSSTSGVVLPAFLPTVAELGQRLSVEPIALASAMNVGGHLVDVSPLSTLGALCMAAAHPSVDTRDLFNKLMAWGLSMTVVGGLVSWLLFSVLGIGV